MTWRKTAAAGQGIGWTAGLFRSVMPISLRMPRAVSAMFDSLFAKLMKPRTTISSELGAFHYGLAAFEGMLVIRAQDPGGSQRIGIFRAGEHIARLKKSAEVIGAGLSISPETVLRNIKKEIMLRRPGSYYVRPMLFKSGDYIRLLHRHAPDSFIVLSKPFNFRIFLMKTRLPISLMLFQGLHSPFQGEFASAKISGRYLVNALAKKRAYDLGYNDAVLCDEEGFITESTSANVFVVQKGVVFTPTTRAIIKGITRSIVMDILREIGVTVTEKDISRQEILEEGSVFITGTASGIVACRKLEGRIIPAHPLVREIQERYARMVTDQRPDAQGCWSYV
ncbi:MAG: aminotransferase class IV [Candidatus Omnitrophica bacterium]|nr:aminotransferase class IV [Candidatus Omnitrophota bacterium]